MIAANPRTLVSRVPRYFNPHSVLRNYALSQLPRSFLQPSKLPVKLGKPKTFQTSTPSSSTPLENNLTSARPDLNLLPISCPGCGAFTQWVDKELAGYYTASRKAVKVFLRAASHNQSGIDLTNESNEEVDAESAASSVDDPKPPKQGDSRHIPSLCLILTKTWFSFPDSTVVAPQFPLCDRCHNLMNHREAQPIPYPPLSYIRDIMEESPWKFNRVYHVLDASDFPMSLVRNIYRDLPIQPPRSQNRRSRTIHYRSGRQQAELHFIITRSDLLGPLKEHVDSLMTYVTQVLRDALGSTGSRIRLGNVHMVSAHRGWWTKGVKKQIWDDGGGVWMVGKTNVGKSNLISAIFPKSPNSAQILRASEEAKDQLSSSVSDGLLPPVQEQYDYPILPIVSACPGTTVSPIRIPFGQKKGEVIDLPGLYRGGLAEHVQEKHKLELVMTKRLKPERYTIKPGQSLILGGLVRITPVDPQDVVLAVPFVPLKAHITSTSKAIEMLAGERPTPHAKIMEEGVEKSIASAGIYELQYDVTKVYGKRLRDTTFQPANEQLRLFKVMSADILIEGCGWVELTSQIRTKNENQADAPKVEIFSPNGGCIGSRRPMTAYSHLQQKRRKDLKKAGRWIRRRKRRTQNRHSEIPA
ncbi:Mitochondrial ribosome small subunit biogenesis protein [Ophidiomyces ophidiicola]|nr:Mitochondrial ribosome small subunit biogenesis protein [Ophidiomyces ophidiicola]